MLTKIGSGQEYIAMGAELIKAGEVVAFPTETVYGLGADAQNSAAVAKIFEAKGRPSDNPLIVHLNEFAQLNAIVESIPKLAYELYNAFCPGPLTMIMKKNANIPDIVTAGLDTVGVRFPSHPAARELIKQSGPIAAPSANASKHVSPTKASHVMEDLGGKIPLIIDGGSCDIGIESTIIDLTGAIPTILRPGIITREMLEKVCKVNYHTGEVRTALAPGMKYVHYSPHCACVVGDNTDSIAALYDQSVAKNQKAIILAKEDTVTLFGARECWSLGKDGKEVANRLYALLHEGEKKYDLILIENLGDDGVFYSIMNRARKAENRGSR
ncbi:MAG: threonylcarbamoyl-AMP synthase [Clostridia bacterium]|nr:threonylcarbamoyl-AMP synthase [Clostridia bacterium]